jgi:hypothetical protein
MDANSFGPVYISYLKLLPNDSAQQAWQQMSLAVSTASKPGKFACATALLVTYLSADIPVHSDGTAWGETAIEAVEDALAANASAPEAVEFVKSVFISQRKLSFDPDCSVANKTRLSGDTIGRESYDHLLVSLSTSLSHRALASETHPSPVGDQAAILALLEMLQPAIGKDPQHFLESDIHRPVFLQIFWLAFLVPDIEQTLRVLARQIWTSTCNQLSSEDRQTLALATRSSVLSAITDVDVTIR